MKVAILAGGMGSRLMEHTQVTPKPMVEVGGYPILWHIMKLYGHYGYNEFVILLGYKGHMIRDFFLNYFNHHSDITVNLAENSVEVHRPNREPWKVTLVETGADTLTGGRILRAKEYLKDAPFMLTYGDGVSNVNIAELVKFHQQQKSMVTLTASVPLEGRFGMLNIDSASNHVRAFAEKPKDVDSFINGGFMVMEPEFLDYLNQGDATILEREPLERAAREGKLSAFQHTDFWHCMDTLRDVNNLNKLWDEGRAPWRVWDTSAPRPKLVDRKAI